MIPAAIRIVVAIAAIAAYAAAERVAPALQLALWNGSHGPANAFGSETWIAPGAAHPAAGWLGDALLARAFPIAGLRGLAVLAALAYAFALAIVERRARARGGALFAALAALLAFACALDAFAVGERLATDALFASLTLAALDRAGRGRFSVAAVAFVWAWLSPDALLAPIFAAATAAGLTLQARITGSAASAAREAWAAAAASLIALIATPAALGYPLASLAALHLDGRKASYSVHPGDVAPLAYHTGFTALLFIAVVVGGRYGPAAYATLRARASAGDVPVPQGASGPADGAVLACAIVLGFFDGYLLPIAGIAAAPVLAGAAARRFGVPRAPRIVPLAVAAAGAIVLIAAVVAVRHGPATRYDASALVPAIARDPDAHVLYCGQPLWCDGALGSHVRTGVDSRTGWPDAAVTDQTTVATIGTHWYRVLERARVDRVVAYRTTALAGLLRLRPDWREIGDDGLVAAFAKRTAGASRP